MTIRIITTASMLIMLGLIAQVFVAHAEVVIDTSSSSTASVSNSLTITTGDTVIESNDTNQSSNTSTTIKGQTTINGVVVPESVIDIEHTGPGTVTARRTVTIDGVDNANPVTLEITQQESATDEGGEPLIERSNVTIEREDIAQEDISDAQSASEKSVNDASQRANILARAWDAIARLFKRLFGFVNV